MTLTEQLTKARARAVPLVAVRTADQPAAVLAIAEAFAESPVVLCDPVTGLRAANAPGKDAVAAMLGELDPAMAGDTVTALTMAQQAPEDTIVVLLAGDRALSEPNPAVAALLLRDAYAQTGRTLVCLGSGWQPAAELGSDVHVLDDDLPDEAERRASIERLLSDAEIDVTESELAEAVAYTRGLSRFQVDQTVALSLNGNGLQVDVLSRVWCEAINRTPGLRVLSTGQTANMDDVAGLDALKAHARRLTNGKGRPDVIVFVDEIEKVLAGSSGAVADSSGASQAVLGGMLSSMEDSKSEGLTAVGPPGGGKSLFATTIGAAAGVPTVQFSPGQVKGSLVGQTEQQVAQVFSVIEAMGGRAYYVATSNGISTIPPELQRRFTDGTWMVDLPSQDERKALWAMYLAKFELSDEAPTAADSSGYSGADVRNVCRTAWRDEVPVAEVMAGYVPSSRSNRDGIEALRRQAHGAYRSASYAGAYRLPADESPATAKGRKLNLGK
jgi:hypothetical protein